MIAQLGFDLPAEGHLPALALLSMAVPLDNSGAVVGLGSGSEGAGQARRRAETARREAGLTPQARTFLGLRLLRPLTLIAAGTAVGAGFFLTFAFVFPAQRLHCDAPPGPGEKPSDVLVDAAKSLVPDETELPGAGKRDVEAWQNGLSSELMAERLKKLLLDSNEYRSAEDPLRTLRSCAACGRTAQKPQVSHTCSPIFCLALSHLP